MNRVTPSCFSSTQNKSMCSNPESEFLINEQPVEYLISRSPTVTGTRSAIRTHRHGGSCSLLPPLDRSGCFSIASTDGVSSSSWSVHSFISTHVHMLACLNGVTYDEEPLITCLTLKVTWWWHHWSNDESLLTYCTSRLLKWMNDWRHLTLHAMLC